MHTTIEMAEDQIPTCNLDSRHGPAFADAAIPQFQNSWAYVCRECFDHYGCSLGLGLGQRIVRIVVL